MENFDFKLLAIYVIATVYAFFAVSPVIMNTIGRFTTQNRFAILMVEEGIITREDYLTTQKSQKIVSVILSIAVLSIAASIIFTNGLKAAVCLVAGLIGGCFKYRGTVMYTSATVKSFQIVYKGKYDIEKLNKFVDKNF